MTLIKISPFPHFKDPIEEWHTFWCSQCFHAYGHVCRLIEMQFQSNLTGNVQCNWGRNGIGCNSYIWHISRL